MFRAVYHYLGATFEKQMTIYWSNLSRLSNMLIIGNFSLFFLTELVIRKGYYYTYWSLGCLFLVELASIMPLGLLNRVWYYCICVVLEFIAIYFFVVSVWYWVVSNLNPK